MTEAKQSFAAKLGVAFVAAAMVFSFAAPSQAQTAEELQQTINDLIAQVTALQAQLGQAPAAPVTGTGVCPFTWTRNLTTGARGEDVMRLQQFLNSNPDTRVAATGVGSAGMETEFFGPMTAAAVSKFQVAYRAEILTPAGLVNPTGFFGPSSRAKANALCAAAPVAPTDPVDEDPTDDEPTTPTTPGEAPLSGGEGTLLVTELFGFTGAIDTGARESVIEVEVEAEDSDIMINRVDFVIGSTTSDVAFRPWLYFQEVNLLVNGTEVASLSGSGDFTDIGNGNYRARFSGLDLILREGDVAEVALEVVALSALPTVRLDTEFDVWHPAQGIRYVDGAGLSENAPAANVGPFTVSVTDAFGDGDIVVSVADNSPENATIVLNETSRTNVVTIGNFNVEALDSDVKITNVEIDVDYVAASAGAAIFRAYLFAGNQQLRQTGVTSAAGASTSTISFTNIDFNISEDDEVEFRVVVDFNRGDTVAPGMFAVGAFRVTGEDEDFEPVSDSGNFEQEHRLIVDGLVAEINSITHTTSNEGKNVTFVFDMDVTAYGSNQFFSEDGDDVFEITVVGPAGATSSISAITSNASRVGNEFRVNRNQTRNVRVSVLVTGASVSGFTRVTLDEMNYRLSTGTAGIYPLSFELGSPEFQSDQVSINN